MRDRVWFDGAQQDAARRLPRCACHGISLVPQSVNNLDPPHEGGPPGGGASRALTSRAPSVVVGARNCSSATGLPEDTAGKYPHEAVGRHGAPRSFVLRAHGRPRVIVADEPTPGLDLDLAVRALDDFRAFADAGGGVMPITHDIELALAWPTAWRCSMTARWWRETASCELQSPDLLQHPFSRELWHALRARLRAGRVDGRGARRLRRGHNLCGTPRASRCTATSTWPSALTSASPSAPVRFRQDHC